MVCPTCGGVERRDIAPGYYECESVVHSISTQMVPDSGMPGHLRPLAFKKHKNKGAFIAIFTATILAAGMLPALAYSPSPNSHPIEGYASELSVKPGDTVSFFASLPKNADGSQRTQYTVQYFRYGNGGNEQPVSMLGPLRQTNGTNQTYTPSSYLYGAGWSQSFKLTVPSSWPSGIYAAQLTDSAETNRELKTAHVTFIVRSAAGSEKPIAFLAGTNTYQAYNFWPGESGSDDSGSLYPNCSGQNARMEVSFMRPAPSATPQSIFVDCGSTDPNVSYTRGNWKYLENVRSDHLVPGDIRIARWLEKQKYSYSMLTDWDIDRDYAADGKLDMLNPAVTPVLIIGTHNEYWSQPMYDALTQYLDRGGNIMVLGGNSLHWRVALTTDPATGNRTVEKFANWTPAEKEKLLGIGPYNGQYSHCYSNLGQSSTSHWAYTSPLAVPTGVYMGGGGEMKTPTNECTATGNRATAVGWELDYADVRFARSWARLAGLDSIQNKSDVFYFQRPSSGSVFVAGSITFGQSLIADANSSGVMTKLVQNVLTRMSKRTFSDFTATDPNCAHSAGKPDILVRRPGEDSLRIYRGLANESLLPGGQVLAGSGWGGYNLLLPVGDFDSDGDSDILARSGSGGMHLHKGNGKGGFEATTGALIDSGWGAFTSIVAPGDWNGDGHPDLLARKSDGSLLLYKGSGKGTFISGSTQVATGLNGLTLVAPGDFDYNTTGSLIRTPGKPDLIGRVDATGELRLYHGNGQGISGSYDVINQGWSGINLVAIGDFSSDTHPDILGCIPGTGEMRVYHGTGGGSSISGYIRNGYTSLGNGWTCNNSLFAGVW